MFTRSPRIARGMRPLVVAVCALALLVTSAATLDAQIFSNQRSVGGVFVDPSGLVGNATVDDQGKLSQERIAAMADIPADLQKATEFRKVSLRQLSEAIRHRIEQGQELPDEVKYLAGLQQIRYVFVYPDANDIVLVGPGEGWKVDRRGNVVGATTGRPVMLLDDLLVALRTARQAANGGISCSIMPTDEGVVRSERFLNQFRTMGDPAMMAAGVERALGPQNVTVTGVPDTTHFARVLVAADYRMKRLAMNFDPSPIRGLPSYLKMMKTGRNRGKSLPRWWLEPDYDPLLQSPDGLAWELRGASVKAMTEEDFVAANGARQGSGRANPVAQRWADMMTEHYDALAKADPIFGDLRNCMELAIVGALMTKENLVSTSGLEMATLLDAEQVKTEPYYSPKHVDSQASLIDRGRDWVVSASGGVQLNSWAVAHRVEKSVAPAKVRDSSSPDKTTHWWWN